jgi:hypothetical protein
MNFDSFSLRTRHLFQNVVYFFFILFEVIHVIHCCFQHNNLDQNYKKSMCSHLKFFLTVKL